MTTEDRALEAARALAQHLRDRPLLPPHPQEASQSWTEVETGIELPLWHCAFEGCKGCFMTEGALGKHLMMTHATVFNDLCLPWTSHDKCDRLGWYMAWYVYAIRVIERQNIPAHGPSIDRRTQQHVTTAYNDDRIRSLVCVCVALKSTRPG